MRSETILSLRLFSAAIRKAKRQANQKPRGYILHETAEYVVIASLESKNRKTGNMVQVWILYRHESPLDAIRSGNDAKICFDCPHRGTTCYVDLSRAPLAVWTAYTAGRYAYLPMERYAEVFADRKVRFGAYGESVCVPLEIMRAIASVARGWTGYTHQWRKPEYQAYRAYVMASCDSVADAEQAAAMGWRRFRVRTKQQPLLAGEISCPASDEMGKRTECVRCGLCNGVASASDARKNIAIIVHGSGAKNFVPLTALAA